jgi:HPt (histidine-containing phosphotransfer) domain-containing protein
MTIPNATTPAEIVVRADRELEDLIPWYLEKRRKDVQKMRQAMEKGDYEGVRTLAHNMKGSGSGYGFEDITQIGAAMEKMARMGDKDSVGRKITELENYLKLVTVTYE